MSEYLFFQEAKQYIHTSGIVHIGVEHICVFSLAQTNMTIVSNNRYMCVLADK